MIRTSSIVSVDHSTAIQPLLKTEARASLSVLKSSKRRITSAPKRHDSVSSSQDAHSDSSQWEGGAANCSRRNVRLQQVNFTRRGCRIIRNKLI